MNTHEFVTDIYLIHCITPMHPGSGDNNFGEIDNLIQRDPASGLPVIYSSTLKGAIKEYCRQDPMPEFNAIFGISGTDNEDDEGSSVQQSIAGKCRFFTADLLALPVQGINVPYYLTSHNEIIGDVNKKLKLLGAALNWDAAFSETDTDLNYEIKGRLFTTPILRETELYHTSDFNSGIAKYLPVISRNQLENGESQNLWYEEIIPRESRFVFAVSVFESDLALLIALRDKINGKLIQIGANASIGYGYCKIEKIN